MSKKRSQIWNFFTVEGNSQQYGRCLKCKVNVPHGGTSSKTYTTSNLATHLRSKHSELFVEYTSLKATEKEERQALSIACSSSTSSKQLTLAETTDRVRVWATNDSRAIRVTRKIGEMIAIDCQPLSIVSDPGFSRLVNTVEPRYQLPSRKYVTDKVIPEIAK